MSLVAAELEQRGISTVVIQLLRLATEKVRPPRALVVPYRHGYPLGSANDPEKQGSVLTAALNLLTDPALKPPAIVDYRGSMAEDG
ncbi:MAG: hypothetical protein WBM69_12985 [Desulfobacterales bacterium]